MSKEQSTSTSNVTLFEEAQRRDKIVRSLAEKCGLKEGDLAIPVRPEKREEYGDKIRIIKVTDSYGKFGRDEVWPPSDNPMIIHAFSEKLQDHFMCTVGFLVKK